MSVQSHHGKIDIFKNFINLFAGTPYLLCLCSSAACYMLLSVFVLHVFSGLCLYSEVVRVFLGGGHRKIHMFGI